MASGADPLAGEGTAARVAFCCTNIDLQSRAAYGELRRGDVPIHVAHCLGLCHVCADVPVALVDGRLVLGKDRDAFGQVLASLLSSDHADADGPAPSAEKR